MKKKGFVMLLVLALVLNLSGAAFAVEGVDEPGVAGIFIDPISNKVLNPAELANMQQNGLEIPVTGYLQYITEKGHGDNPRLTDFIVVGQLWDPAGNSGAGAWVDDEIIINWATTPIESITIRDGKKGREFTDSAFSKADWLINKTGSYRVKANAHFTAGALPEDTEEFDVELVSASITVSPMAAPNIAEIILQKEGINPNMSTGKGKDRIFINLIQLTAQHMGPQTLFDGTEKSTLNQDGFEVCNPAYWNAVLEFLQEKLPDLDYSLDDYIADLEAQQ